MSSSFEIVNDNPFFKDYWESTDESSPDYELGEDYSLIKLRKISKKLVKNNFIAFGALTTYINTIIGGDLTIGIINEDDSITDKTDDKFKDSIISLLETTLSGVDLNRQYNLAQIVEQIISSSFIDGDVLINLPIDKRSESNIQTYIELIEASRIKTPPKHRDNSLVREGVEYWESGRLKGYHVIKNNNKNSFNYAYGFNDDDFTFLPVYKSDGEITRRVCFLFKAPLNLRPNQSRQFPVMTGIMDLLRYFNQYLEAVLIGARVAACFAGFVKTNNPDAARKSLTESGEDTTIKTKGKKLTKLQPGIIGYLRPNEEITFASPNRPSDNFDTFILRLCRFIAMCLRMPYEQLFLDLSIVNYSSWRGGSLEVDRNFNRWRRDLTFVLKWVILTFLREGIANRVIKGDLSKIILQVIFPKYKSLDEEKTARARKINIVNKTTSIKQAVDEDGKSFDNLQEELDIQADLEVDRQARILVRQKEWEKKEGITFSEKEKGDRNTSKREGEQEGSDLDEDDAKDRRKDDGNW
jgi:lambda family phage portal protein